MRFVVILSLWLLSGVGMTMDKVAFMQQFEGRYLVVIGEGLPICLKVSSRKVRAVNQQDVCARLQRASIRQNGEVCIKPDKPGASARCELVDVLNGRYTMGTAQRPIESYGSKQALILALKHRGEEGFVDPLGLPIEE